jgi:uncharacterized membrane protein YgcG
MYPTKEEMMRQHSELRSAWHGLLACVVTVIFAALLDGCAGAVQVASRWDDNPIRIDGDSSDWTDSTVFVQKDDFRLGVMNDDKYLYVCLMSNLPNLGRQVMFRGMTIWFDPNGGEKKTVGIRYPIGMGGMGMPVRAEGGEGNQGDQGDRDRSRFDPETSPALSEFEYLGPSENDRQRVSKLEAQGVEVQLKSTQDRFVYELKIPLVYSSQHPYSLETRPGSAIGIGVESNAPQRSQFAQRGEGSGRGGVGGGEGRGFGGGGRGGMRGGMRGGAGGERPSGSNANFSFWGHVQLAEKGH